MLCDFFYLRNKHERVPDLNDVKSLRILVPRDKVYAVILNDALEPFIHDLKFSLPPNRPKGLYQDYSIPYGLYAPIEHARNIYRALVFAGFTVWQQYESVLMPIEIEKYFPHLPRPTLSLIFASSP